MIEVQVIYDYCIWKVIDAQRNILCEGSVWDCDTWLDIHASEYVEVVIFGWDEG